MQTSGFSKAAGSRTPALAVEITSPGGAESYYHDMAAATSPAQAMAVQAEYGVTFHGGLAALLISRHGLHVGDMPRQWQ